MSLYGTGWRLSVANHLVSSINTALAMAPGAQKHLKNLEACILKLHLSGINLVFYFGVTAHTDEAQTTLESTQTLYKVQLVEPVDNPDVALSGSVVAFMKLLGQRNKSGVFRSKELVLQGDAVRIQQILAFLNALEVDWDGLLANFIGDVPAHFLGTTLRNGFAWGRSFSQSFIRDAEEYIKYELRLLPDKARASKQFSAISELSNDIEKLKARFDKVEQQIQP